MNEIHELKELEHKIEEAMNRPPDTRDEETLAEYEDNVIQDGLFGIRELSEMKPETERKLFVQGFGSYHIGYMRRWAQFVLYGHENRYHRLCQENRELKEEMRAIQQIVMELCKHLEERDH